MSLVERIIVIQDNAQNYSGPKIVQDAVNLIGRGEIIVPPVGKDANDVPPRHLHAWLEEYGIDPLPLYML